MSHSLNALFILIILVSCIDNRKETSSKAVNGSQINMDGTIMDSSEIVKIKDTFSLNQEYSPILKRKELQKETIKSDLIQKKIILKYRNVLSGKLQIKIPVSFNLMPDENLKFKYPNSNPKTIDVYTNTEETINVLFNLSDEPLQHYELPSVLTQIVEKFETIKSITIEKAELQNINNKEIVVIAFNSEAIDTKIYNIMFITDLDGKSFTGSFNCTFNELNDWKPIGMDIVKSMKVNR